MDLHIGLAIVDEMERTMMRESMLPLRLFANVAHATAQKRERERERERKK